MTIETGGENHREKTALRFVKVNSFSYCYRADISTIFGMRSLWGLTINSGRGATLK